MSMMPDLEESLAVFEAEYEVQEQGPGGVSPLGEKVTLSTPHALMAEFFGEHFDFGRYWEGSAEAQIVYQLNVQLFRKRHFPQLGIKLRRYVQPDFGIGLVATVLGVPFSPRPRQEPWASGAPPITDMSDLDKRPLPDFATAGIMPSALKLRTEMQTILGSSFEVGLPEWIRGPLGNAFYLTGAEQTLISLYADRDFFHRVMRYGMDAMKRWVSQRAIYLDAPVSASAVSHMLWDDEVAAENFPPEVYEQFIAPYEREYFDFFGGSVGWHSCARTTPLMKAISATAPWTCFHVSPWSDLDEALRVFPDTPLIVCLHPYKEVLGAACQQTETRVREIASKCRGHDYVIGLTELLPVNGLEEDLRRLKDTIAVCEDVLLSA